VRSTISRYLAAKPIPAVVHLQFGANNNVSWMVLPTTAQAGSPHVGFDLAVEAPAPA
jgi:hypothetical protein